MQKFIPKSKLEYDKADTSFAIWEITVFQEDHLRAVKLLLPTTETIDLLVRVRSDAARRMADRYTEAELEKAQAARAAKRPPEQPPPVPFAPVRRKKFDRSMIDKERGDLKSAYGERVRLASPDDGSPRMVQVYAWDEPLKLLEQASPDEQLRDRDLAIFDELKERGAFRQRLGDASLDSTLDALKAMRKSQPHFSAVIDFIQGQILVARELKRPQHIPPFLIFGAEGVGKTHFTLELSRCLGRMIHRHSFDAGHTGDGLTGSDRHWGNTAPGLVFKAICQSDAADPLILLDEIDKATSVGKRNPLAPLHSLLEPLTSNQITDISVGLTFDASHVTWVATANYLECVPETIRSRFRIFHSQMPSAEQSLQLALNVATTLHARFPGFAIPSRLVVRELAHLSPREQIQALEHAYAGALVNGRKHLVPQDLPKHVTELDPDDALDAPILQ